jgi:protein-disulfide isomerase
MTTTTTPRTVTRPVGHRRSEALPWVSTGGRVLLAGVLAYAASSKLFDPLGTVRAVRAYRLLPEALAVPFAHALPWVELALAVLLLLGIAVRLTAVLTATLLAVFVGGMASAAARGLKIDCGCFGGGGPTQHPRYALDLVRDGSFLLVAALVAWLPRSRFALEPAVPSVEALPATSRRERQAQHLQTVRRDAALTRRRSLRWLVLVTLVAAAAIGLVAGKAGTPSASATPRGSTAAGGILVGLPSAPHHVVLYEDPQCPICQRFESSGGTALARAVAQGLVQVEYRMRSFLGPESVRAVAALGAAADDGRFEPLREQLYLHQPAERTGGYTVDDLLALGRAAGLTSPSYQQKVRTQRYATWARRTDDAASRAGNIGTPDLWLDGKNVPLSLALQPARLAPLLGLSP